jgi:SAM-dependent methyltransferase
MSFERSRAVYDRHVGRYSSALARALIERTGVRDGDGALDVGCGPGALTEALAERLGESDVAAVDPSHSFVEECRRRVPAADVRLGAAEALPFPDASFDVVSSQLVVNFMHDAPAGVREMARVARRAVSSCVWDYAGEMWMLRRFWEGARDIDPDAPDEAATMSYCSPDELARLWSDAGLGDVETGELVVDAAYDDFDDYWSGFPEGPGPSGAYTAGLGPERRQQLRAAVRRRLGDPNGPFTLTARAWFVRGTVAG